MILYIYILVYTNVGNFYQDTRSTLGLQLWDQSIPGAPLLRSLFSTEPKKWFEGHHVCISCSGGVLKSSKPVKGKALSLERLGFHLKNYIGGGFKYLLFSSIFGEMIQIDEHIFQMGWFNHQPATILEAGNPFFL